VDVVPPASDGGAAMEAVQTVRDLIRLFLVSSLFSHARACTCVCLSSLLFGSVWNSESGCSSARSHVLLRWLDCFIRCLCASEQDHIYFPRLYALFAYWLFNSKSYLVKNCLRFPIKKKIVCGFLNSLTQSPIQLLTATAFTY